MVYQRSQDANAESKLVYNGSADPLTTRLNVSSLVASSEYVFSVIAINQYNVSSREDDNVIHMLTLQPSSPSVVRDLGVLAATGGSLTLTYAAALDTGGYSAESLQYYVRARFLTSCYSSASGCTSCTHLLDQPWTSYFVEPVGNCTETTCYSGSGGKCCYDSNGRECGIIAEETAPCSPPPSCTLLGLEYFTRYLVSVAAGNPTGNGSFSHEIYADTRYCNTVYMHTSGS